MDEYEIHNAILSAKEEIAGLKDQVGDPEFLLGLDLTTYVKHQTYRTDKLCKELDQLNDQVQKLRKQVKKLRRMGC